MEIIFDSEDKTEAKQYEEIIKDALRLHATLLKKIHVFVNIKEPLFIVHVSWMKKPKIVLKEMATVETHPEGVKIELKEGFRHRASELFEVLRSAYGEEYVEQKEYAIIVKEAKPQDLDLVTDFTDEKTIDTVMDVLTRIVPEGFRVTHILRDHDSLTLVSSENPIKKEWIEKARQIHKSSA